MRLSHGVQILFSQDAERISIVAQEDLEDPEQVRQLR